jgi:hypothetical protein
MIAGERPGLRSQGRLSAARSRGAIIRGRTRYGALVRKALKGTCRVVKIAEVMPKMVAEVAELADARDSKSREA